MAKRQNLFSGLLNTAIISGVDLSLVGDLSNLTAQLQSPEKARRVLEGRDSNGYTLLHHAALNGCVGALKILLAHEADPNSRSFKQVTPVHLAAGGGQLECVRLLLEYGGRHDCKDNEKKSPLDYAEKKGHTFCKNLLAKHTAAVQDIQTNELLVVLDTLGLIMNRDPILNSFDVIETDTNGHINLDVISRKYSLDCQSCLLSSVPAALAAMPKILTNCSILHVACQFDRFQEVQYLLQKHPNMLYSTSEEGYTPLHIAVMCNSERIVNYILQKLINQCHSTNLPVALDNDSSKNHVSSTASLPQQTVQAVFLVNSRTCLGHTVLHLAAILNHPSLLTSLCLVPDPLQLDIEAQDKVEFTPLHAATFANALDAIKVLLNNNANPNCCTSLTTYTDVYKTPLAQACAMGHIEVFDALMEKGAIDQDLVAVKWCLSCGSVDSETFTKVLATYIKKDELSRFTKLHRREEGFSISKAVSLDWSTIPLKDLEMKWVKLALVHCPLLSQTKAENALCNVTSVSLSSCSLTELPLELFKLPEVISVNVSNNMLTAVPALTPNCESFDESGWACTYLAKLDFSSNQLKVIPEFLFELPNLKVLNVSTNFIHNISMKLWIAPRLCEFRCSHNQVSFIPSCWEDHVNQVAQDMPASTGSFRYKNSRLTKLSGSLPRVTRSASQFTTITEDSEDYTVTPPIDLKSQGYLYPSDASDSEDETRLSETLTNQTSLQNRMIVTSSSGLLVDWDKEQATEDKSDFLMMLDFSHNRLTLLPPDLPCLAPKLIRLDVSHNNLSSITIPKGFPADLKNLNLSYNPLKVINSENCLTTVLPCTNPYQEMCDWNCTTFCTHRNHSQLINLQVLDLSNCELSSVNVYTPLQQQKELKDKIRKAETSSTKYTGEELPLLKAVRSSCKTFHEIKPLAKLVFPLLSRLIMKNNSLQSIPDSVCDMVALASLDMSYNPIIELNKEMGQLYNLWEFPLEGLQLISPPQNILSRGKTKDIVGFLCSLLKQSQPYHRMKLMLVGRSARGKTTLLNKITEKGWTSAMPRWGEREQRPKAGEDTPVTVGIAVSNWTYMSRYATKGRVRRITFKTWDFAGQEDYYATHQYFLSQRSLYLAIWNSSHGREGVEELKSWLLNIQARAPRSPVIIVGTHGDLITNKTEQLQNLDLIDRLYGSLSHKVEGYPPIMASMIVSSVTGAGIKDLREKIFTVASELSENTGSRRRDGIHYKLTTHATRLLMDQLVPASYLQLEDTVRKIAQHYHNQQKPPVLTAQEFRKEVFKDAEIRISRDINDKELEQAVRFLHDNGTLLHYEDNVLNDFYFVDPQWLCDLLAHIVTVPQKNPFVKDGIMMLKDMSQIFRSKEFPNRWQKEYLHLLTQFEVAIQLNHESILIPSFLPEKPPTLPVTMYPEEVVCLPPIRNLLKTTFVPVGFWSRLMSRLFADTSIELLAKEGCGITKENEATSPALNWVKSRCSLEYQYGNLTLFRLAEVSDSYLADPTVKTVSIMRQGRYHKIANKNFRGITMDVMDIYPVIKYSEIKYAERLTVIKEEDKEVSTSHDVAQDRKTSGEINSGDIVINVNGDVKTKGDTSVPPSPGKHATNHTDDANRKLNEVSAPFLPSKPVRKKHSYEPIDFDDIFDYDSTSNKNSKCSANRRRSSVYEVLDLAIHVSSRKSSMWSNKSSMKSRKSSMASHSVESPVVESPVVEALDLDNLSHFRTRSWITVSCKPSKESEAVGNVSIARQRSIQIANEVTRSLDTAGEMRSKIIPVHPKRESTSSTSSRGTSKSGESSKNSSHLTVRSHQTRISRKRRSRRWDRPKPLKPLGISEAAHDRMRAGLVAKVMEHINILVSEWFSGIKPELLIPCPYCMISRPHTTLDSPIHLCRAFSNSTVLMSLTKSVTKGGDDEDVTNAYVFSFDDCVWLSRKSCVMYCPAHGDIPLEFFVPDVAFASLGKDVIVHNNQITVLELLGEGTFAKVFKATLKQEKPPAPLEVKTVAMKAFTKKEWSGIERAKNEPVSEILVESTEVQAPQPAKGSVDLFPKRSLISIETMAEAHRSMRSELSVLSQLNHENIISLVGVLVVPPSILLEYAPMGTMKEVYKSYWQSSQRLLPEISQATIIQLALGIEFLHKRSIVYRDLKGENILVWRFPMPNNLPLFSSNYDVHVKLADYGISQFSNINGLLGFAGTPGFIAPEIIKYHGKEVYTNKVDIFSLSMVIYELTTLHSPYEKLSPQQANQAIESGTRPTLSKKDLNSLILQRELMIWCWQQDPEMRPTATQVVEAAKSEQFCRLIDGILIDNNARVLCACKREIVITMRQRSRSSRTKLGRASSYLEMSANFIEPSDNIQTSETTAAEKQSVPSRSVSAGQTELLDVEVSDERTLTLDGSTLTRKLDAVHKYELWVSSSDVHSSCITIIDYCEKFTSIKDIKVCACPILSICLVNDMVWMGSEVGFLYIYDANKRLPLAQAWLEDNFPILDILHVKETQLAYIALENGSVYAVKDDISVQMNLAGVSPALINLEVVAKHKRVNSIAACLTVVPKNDLSFEIWVGQKNRNITVLDAENLNVVATLCVSSDVSKVSHYIAHLTVANLVCHYMQPSVASNNGTTAGNGNHSRGDSYLVEKESVSVFAAVYHGQFITQLDADTKESVDLLNCCDYLNDDKYDCKISSLHIVDMGLFVGLLSGKLLMIDLQSMSPLAVFHCHEDRVKPIFSLKVTSGGQQDKTKHRLMSCGSGFKSYFKNNRPVVSEDGSLPKKPSQLLVWDIDHL